MNDENYRFLDPGCPTNFEYDLSVIDELGNFVAEEKAIALAPSVGVHASPGDFTDEQLASNFVQEHRAHEGEQGQSPPQYSPFETKKHRGETMGQLPATNVAGATHFYLALQVEWYFKMVPGTFARRAGS
jgi:hypothetical protein